MSEHELRTMLRDHLSDEPPVNDRSRDTIRTARRGTHRRLAFTGVAAVAALGLSAGLLPGLLADDGPSTARETTGFAGPAGGTYADRVQAVAQDELGQYVDLGAADLWMVNVDDEVVPADSPELQTVAATYDLGVTVVDVDVTGFAPEEFGTFRIACNPGGWQASCEAGSLPDGSTFKTEVDTAQQAGPAGAMRSRSPAWAADHPDDVFWGRSVHLSTPSGLDVFVAEYVRAPTLDEVQWEIPAHALMGVATDATVLDPTGLAHSPVCQSAHTSC
jgi:hypothetical protein